MSLILRDDSGNIIEEVYKQGKRMTLLPSHEEFVQAQLTTTDAKVLASMELIAARLSQGYSYMQPDQFLNHSQDKMLIRICKQQGWILKIEKDSSAYNYKETYYLEPYKPISRKFREFLCSIRRKLPL